MAKIDNVIDDLKKSISWWRKHGDTDFDRGLSAGLSLAVTVIEMEYRLGIFRDKGTASKQKQLKINFGRDD